MIYPAATPQLNISKSAPFIFLAEDDVDDQELLIEAFTAQSQSLKIQTATNGKKAALFLDELSDDALPCLIVLDYNLPEVDGAQLLELLTSKKRYDEIPKVVWSTSNSPLYKRLCLEMGAKAYFVKPNDLKGIQTLAKEMLAFCGTAKPH
ncbi:MAG TPA: response regulator [Flavisolibacter sp.]|jgi:CheY-like chemotaxis protein